MKKIYALAIVIFSFSMYAHAQLQKAQLDWQETYNNSDSLAVIGTAIDVDGCVYVLGSSSQYGVQNSANIVLFRYSKQGQLLWIRTYDGPDHEDDYPVSLEIGKDNNIYFTGYSFGIYSQIGR